MTRLRFGMVGGGPGAFIGEVHRMAATLDGEAELVAGAFSLWPGRVAVALADLWPEAADAPLEVYTLALACRAATVFEQ